VKDNPQKKPCPVCGSLPQSIEIENAADLEPDQTRSTFPAEVLALESPDPALEWFFRFSEGGLLLCPACGVFFQYARWTPGGSDDVFRTYVHEAVTRIGLLQVHKELEHVLHVSRERRKDEARLLKDGYSNSARAAARLLRALHRRGGEVIQGAVQEILHKHRYSEELGEMLTRLKFAHEKQVADARVREEKVAEYHARVVLHYARHVEDAQGRNGLLETIAGLSDDNAAVREALETALDRLRSARRKRFVTP
jgi:hypothetical protein